MYVVERKGGRLTHFPLETTMSDKPPRPPRLTGTNSVSNHVERSILNEHNMPPVLLTRKELPPPTNRTQGVTWPEFFESFAQVVESFPVRGLQCTHLAAPHLHRGGDDVRLLT